MSTSHGLQTTIFYRKQPVLFLLPSCCVLSHLPPDQPAQPPSPDLESTPGPPVSVWLPPTPPPRLCSPNTALSPPSLPPPPVRTLQPSRPVLTTELQWPASAPSTDDRKPHHLPQCATLPRAKATSTRSHREDQTRAACRGFHGCCLVYCGAPTAGTAGPPAKPSGLSRKVRHMLGWTTSQF